MHARNVPGAPGRAPRHDLLHILFELSTPGFYAYCAVPPGHLPAKLAPSRCNCSHLVAVKGFTGRDGRAVP